jgi:hypothetical protein
VLLPSLLLTTASRQQALARFAAMGLSSAQSRLLVFIELLPQLLAALTGGLVCAGALVPALGPVLSLTSFTGFDGSVPVRLEPAWLAGTALALLFLAAAALTSQSLLTSRTTARWHRIGE